MFLAAILRASIHATRRVHADVHATLMLALALSLTLAYTLRLTLIYTLRLTLTYTLAYILAYTLMCITLIESVKMIVEVD